MHVSEALSVVKIKRDIERPKAKRKTIVLRRLGDAAREQARRDGGSDRDVGKV